MKIINNELIRVKVPFNDLSPGDVFMSGGTVFIKVRPNTSGLNAVRPGDGCLAFFGNKSVVLWPDAALVRYPDKLQEES